LTVAIPATIAGLVGRGKIKREQAAVLLEILRAVSNSFFGTRGSIPQSPNDTREAVTEVAGQLPVRAKDALIIVEAAKDVLKQDGTPLYKWEDALPVLIKELGPLAGKAFKDKLTK
jgi:hypothetical protein